MYKSISKCRICGNKNLEVVLDLGKQVLTGVFPKEKSDDLTKGPLKLVKCIGHNTCGLLQLAHSYSLDEMYGDNYGYRSGLNPSMVAHLNSKVEKIKKFGILKDNDIVVDIGSNDATTLKSYKLDNCKYVGIDPTGVKFKEYYTSGIDLIPDFFSAKVFKDKYGDRKAKVITSFSMFYDLEDPVSFMREISDILDDDGIWVFEQSYMPLMLSTNSYDTVCHEHLEYYALEQILWMADKVGMKIIDVELNNTNGGSFSVTAQKCSGSLEESPSVQLTIDSEKRQKLDDLQTYFDFSDRAVKSKESLVEFINNALKNGKKIAALGASTKGNVVLQYCGLDESTISYVGEVNPDKFGSYTPGTLIPIVDESEILKASPDYVVVLPWHFREYFDNQEKYRNLNLVYPLPVLSVD